MMHWRGRLQGLEQIRHSLANGKELGELGAEIGMACKPIFRVGILASVEGDEIGADDLV
jgi:hypothetical protein